MARKPADLDYQKSLAEHEDLTPSILDEVVKRAKLLERYKVVNDSVWDRIWLTELETHVIDVAEFQRLRWVLQLGAAMYVYPTATHTRFEHSLGTLEAAERIVRACNDNKDRYESILIGRYAHFIIRLAALIHDYAQMPHAHAFEDEGHLFEVEWKCDPVAVQLLGPKGNVADGVLGFLKERFRVRNVGQDPQGVTDHVIEDLRWILTSGSTRKGDDQPPPEGRAYLRYCADIVGNTLCADLVDYLLRDFEEIGFGHMRKPRILEFFIVREVDGQPRPVLVLWKPGKEEVMRRDVVSEAVDLLELRYKLAAEVYFHHGKAAAASMMIRAVDLRGLSATEIWPHGDHSLLRLLQHADEAPKKFSGMGDETACKLAEAVANRSLYKLVYELPHKEGATPADPSERAKELYARIATAAENQRGLEEALCKLLGLPREAVVVYCPDPDMNLKLFEALIWPAKATEPIRLEDPRVSGEEGQRLKGKHRALWRLRVFASRDAQEAHGALIKKACRALLESGTTPDLDDLADFWWKAHESDIAAAIPDLASSEATEGRSLVRSGLESRFRDDPETGPSGGLARQDHIPEAKAIIDELLSRRLDR